MAPHKIKDSWSDWGHGNLYPWNQPWHRFAWHVLWCWGEPKDWELVGTIADKQGHEVLLHIMDQVLREG